MAATDVLRSAVFRLGLLATAVVAAVAAAAIVLVGAHVNQRLTRATEAAVERDAGELRRTFTTEGFAALAAAVEARSRQPGAGGALYFLSDHTGARRTGNLVAPPATLSGGTRGTFAWQHGLGPAGLRTAAGVLVSLDGAGVLVVARDVEEQKSFLGFLQRDFAFALAAIGLVGIGLALVLAQAILRRIDAMSRATGAIMAGDLSGRLPRTGSDDELDRLAAQLNAMLERIERLMAGLREVSDNIAHDLKTPLNRLRNRAEAALADRREATAWREGLEQTIEAADELIKTFNALLLIARLEAGNVEDTLAPVDLAEIVQDVAELYDPAAEQAGLVLETRIAGRALVAANRQLVGQALANLVDNAIKYSATASGTRSTPSTPHPTVSISLATTGTEARLVVADRGPGIAAADRQRALERFVRLDASRSKPGTGLGLSLVAAVVQMHRGRISLEDNAPGLTVVLTFPLATRTGDVPGISSRASTSGSPSAGESRAGGATESVRS